MYAYIRGLLVQASPHQVVLETNGIGHLLAIPNSLFSRLPAVGQELLLHVSLVIREDHHTLYGFLSWAERELFQRLLTVTGIGPKLAISLIGHFTIEGLQEAIRNREISCLCRVPGVGRKTAERLCIELQDKLQDLHSEGSAEQRTERPLDAKTRTLSDALSALMNLGYSQATAQKAIKKSLDEIPVETDLAGLITGALKHL